MAITKRFVTRLKPMNMAFVEADFFASDAGEFGLNPDAPVLSDIRDGAGLDSDGEVTNLQDDGITPLLSDQTLYDSTSLWDGLLKLQTADSDLDFAFGLEIDTLHGMLADLALSIDAEDLDLSLALLQEVSDRASADSTLQSNIDTEASTRLEQDNEHDASIDDLQAKDLEHDASIVDLQTDLASEASTRDAKDLEHDSSIDDLQADLLSEISTRETQFDSLQAQDTEHDASISDIISDLNSEASTRDAKDLEHDASIDELQTAIIDLGTSGGSANALVSLALEAEIDRALAEELELSLQIGATAQAGVEMIFSNLTPFQMRFGIGQGYPSGVAADTKVTLPGGGGPGAPSPSAMVAKLTDPQMKFVYSGKFELNLNGLRLRPGRNVGVDISGPNEYLPDFDSMGDISIFDPTATRSSDGHAFEQLGAGGYYHGDEIWASRADVAGGYDPAVHGEWYGAGDGADFAMDTDGNLYFAADLLGDDFLVVKY